MNIEITKLERDKTYRYLGINQVNDINYCLKEKIRRIQKEDKSFYFKQNWMLKIKW